MITYEWIWVAVIVATTVGAAIFCAKKADEEIAAERNKLQSDLDHARKRKRYWKAIAKGKASATTAQSPRTIPMAGRLSTGGAH